MLCVYYFRVECFCFKGLCVCIFSRCLVFHTHDFFPLVSLLLLLLRFLVCVDYKLRMNNSKMHMNISFGFSTAYLNIQR